MTMRKVKSPRTPLLGKVASAAPDTLTPEQAWEKRRQGRADRRRAERLAKQQAAAQSARVCWRCGFGAVKGVPFSNLVLMKDISGQEAYGHPNPVVCAGMVKAVTGAARESVGEAASDLSRTLRNRIEGFIRYQWGKFVQFLKEDDNSSRGGRASEKTRGVAPSA